MIIEEEMPLRQLVFICVSTTEFYPRNFDHFSIYNPCQKINLASEFFEKQKLNLESEAFSSGRKQMIYLTSGCLLRRELIQEQLSFWCCSPRGVWIYIIKRFTNFEFHVLHTTSDLFGVYYFFSLFSFPHRWLCKHSETTSLHLDHVVTIVMQNPKLNKSFNSSIVLFFLFPFKLYLNLRCISKISY